MDEITELINAYQSDGLAPGISLAVIKNGRCIYQVSHGYANLEHQIRINSKTNFYLASVSKTFTASAIMILQKQCLLDIHDPIHLYFNDLPDYYQDIKIIHLINHTSGLKDYFSEFINQDQIEGVTNKKVYQYLIHENILTFTPGSQFSYSNTGYVLLALLVEKVSGISFSDFIKKQIFEPLGMMNSYVYGSNQPVIPNKAYEYQEIENEYGVDQHKILTTGDGGFYSNIEDLMKWSNSFENGSLFSKDMIEQIFTSTLLPDNKPVGYGYGWFIRNRNDHQIVFHDGSAFNYRTLLGKSIDDSFSIVVLTNIFKEDAWKAIYHRCSNIIAELSRLELT